MGLNESMIAGVPSWELEKAHQAWEGYVTDEELGLDKPKATREQVEILARELLTAGGWGKRSSDSQTR